MKLLIVKNITHEGPWLLKYVLDARSVDYDLIDLENGDAFPPVESYDAVVVLWWPDSANDTTEKMIQELVFVKDIVEKQVPYLWICLGMQVLVKAAWWEVIKHAEKEIGFYDDLGEQFSVELTQQGINDTLFSWLDHVFDVFHLHGETVIPNEHVVILWTWKQCYHQIVKVGPCAYGIQCHFELSDDMLEVWYEKDEDLWNKNRDLLFQQYNLIKNEYEKVWYQLMNNFIDIVSEKMTA